MPELELPDVIGTAENISESTRLASRIRDRNRRIEFWNEAAGLLSKRSLRNYYHRRLADIYRRLIQPGLRVLEIGSGSGDLLAAVRPMIGVGIDFSPEMVNRAREQYPDMNFILADVNDVSFAEIQDESFDVIIFSDILNDLWDVQETLEKIAPCITPRTRIIINTYSRLWEMPLKWSAKMKLANTPPQSNWLTCDDIGNLLQLTNFEVMRSWQEIFCPVRIPLINQFCNKFLVRLWPWNYFALTNFIIARSNPVPVDAPLRVSVIVPARNEAGNIAGIIKRTPEMGSGTELIFVEGNSSDNTYEVIKQQTETATDRNCLHFQQTGLGKGDAVRLGFAKATGDIVMILDADMTVPPEDLPRFVAALQSGKGEFINGVRLVYPQEKQAMRFLNLLGNKFFSLAFSWLLEQPIKDTLCGTKVMWKSDYERIAANRAYFGDFDPFGDFDLIFGACRLNLRIVDLPIRYRERLYGTTNISRWSSGWLLLKMVVFAARRIKFV